MIRCLFYGCCFPAIIAEVNLRNIRKFICCCGPADSLSLLSIITSPPRQIYTNRMSSKNNPSRHQPSSPTDQQIHIDSSTRHFRDAGDHLHGDDQRAGGDSDDLPIAARPTCANCHRFLSSFTLLSGKNCFRNFGISSDVIPTVQPSPNATDDRHLIEQCAIFHPCHYAQCKKKANRLPVAVCLICSQFLRSPQVKPKHRGTRSMKHLPYHKWITQHFAIGSLHYQNLLKSDATVMFDENDTCFNPYQPDASDDESNPNQTWSVTFQNF